MKKIIVLIVITLCTTLFGQEREATILFNDSTSVKGFGEIRKEKIYFRASLDAKIKEWDFEMSPGLIFSGYGFSEKYLTALILKLNERSVAFSSFFLFT